MIKVDVPFESRLRKNGPSYYFVVKATTVEKILQKYKIKLSEGKVYDFNIILEVKENGN